jgi:hypothetical protein
MPTPAPMQQCLRRGFYDLGKDVPPAVRIADAFAELALVM